MNKQELVEVMATAADITKAAAESALNSALSAITDTLQKKDEVSIAHFGSFKTSERAEREGRNPRTGETMTIAAATVVKFKVSKRLKDAVNG